MFTKPLELIKQKGYLHLIAVLLILLTQSINVHGQQNPWEHQKGTNPWGAETTISDEKKTPPASTEKTTPETSEKPVNTKIDTAIAQPILLETRKPETIETLGSNDLVYNEKYKSYFYKIPNSNYYSFSKEIHDTIFLSTDQGKVLIVDRNDHNSLRYIQKYSYHEYNAHEAFVGTFLTSTILNVFSIPINLLTLAFSTNKKEKQVTEFIKDNRSAREREINQIKKGIQTKRAQNTGGGTLAGIVLSFILWVNVFN